MKISTIMICAAMASMPVAAQTVIGGADGPTSIVTTSTLSAKAMKAKKAADLKAFKAKQKAELAEFVALQNNPELALKPMKVVKPVLENGGDTVAYLFGSYQATGLKEYLGGQLNVDTALYMNEFYKELLATTSADPDDGATRARMAARQIGNRISDMANSIGNDYYAGDKDKRISAAIIGNAIVASLTGSNEYTMDEAQTLFSSAMETRKEEMAKVLRQAGEEWLKENAKKEGVVVLPSGLQYKVITQGTGEKPTASQRVTVNYEGKLIDGTVFDSSYKRGQPATFALSQVIRGWTEALQLMPVGSKWEVYIPQELGYGDRDQGTIPPYSTLIFTVELMEIAE